MEKQKRSTDGKKRIAINRDAMSRPSAPAAPPKKGGAGCLLTGLLIGACLFAAHQYTPAGPLMQPWLSEAENFVAFQVNRFQRGELDPYTGFPETTLRTRNWQQNENYRLGKTRYEQAREQQQAYVQSRDREHLATARQYILEAIEALRAARPYMPPEAGLQPLLDRCFHLLTDTLVPEAHLAPPAARTPPPQPRTPPATDRPERPAREPSWREDANYVQGLQLKQDAIRMLHTFRQERNQDDLPRIEQKCRDAIEAFTTAQPRLPPEANLHEHIRQCNQIISETRRSRQISF